MGIKINGAIALAVTTLLVAGTGVYLLRAEPAARSEAAPEVAVAPAAKVPGPQDALPLYTPGAENAQTAVAPPAASPAPAADDALTIKRVLPIQGPIKYGEWHWDDANVPAGPIIITVDLDARVMSVFKGGYEIGAAAVLLGTPEKPTPTGVFPIMGKARHHVSNIYNAPMPYMQRLTHTGIALHASTVERFYASHGCVGMPEPFAKKVFETTKVGDRVIITKGKMVSQGDVLASN
jgi:lipoprotein-anchoring transpeptidase ErfK/SrfK